MLASQKLKAIVQGGFLGDALVEEYEDFFYLLTAWEQTPLASSVSDDYTLDSDTDLYMLPEFWEFREVSLSHAALDGEGEAELIYSSSNVARLLENFFFKKTPGVCYGEMPTYCRDTFFLILMHLCVG
jgi:hypothetical protein